MDMPSKRKYVGAKSESVKPVTTPGGKRLERNMRRGANRNSDSQGSGHKTERKGVAPPRALSGREGSPYSKTRYGQ